jgi:quinoprotein glucose dehydrogenase
VRKNGKKIDAVAQATKQGFVFVFERVTGAPVWPIEERAVPASDVPGEQAWPTQPFSTLPPSGRQVVKADDLSPYLVNDAERADWIERIGKARTGLFNPPALVETAVVPGAVGGTNWGNTAANPRAGILYLLTQDFPSFYRLTEQPDRGVAGGRSHGGAPDAEEIERGVALYKSRCALCHGDDRAGTPAAPSLLSLGSPLGFSELRRIVLYGTGRMPPVGDIENSQIRDLMAYLGGGDPRRPNDSPVAMPSGPVVASGGVPRPVAAPRPPINPAQPYPAGVAAPAQRYFTDYGLGYPYLLAPPWSSIVAYDLNRGVIKWKRPIGQTRADAGSDAEDTGVPRGAQRQGMIVTSTGIVFSTARDGRFYAFDADDGDVLWSAALPMGSEGLPAVYSVGNKHYIVVNATTPNTWGIRSRATGAGAQGPAGGGGYVVFALP